MCMRAQQKVINITSYGYDRWSGLHCTCLWGSPFELPPYPFQQSTNALYYLIYCFSIFLKLVLLFAVIGDFIVSRVERE